MEYVVISLVALVASGLTFFSGFGLGTLLLPVFAFFMPVEQAIATTAVVHLLNGLFKVLLVGRHATRNVVLRFGIPAIGAALIGAWLLLRLAHVPTVYTYEAWGRTFTITVVKLVVGLLLSLFAVIEVVPRLRTMTFDPQYLPLGGVLSGFFGGLTGMQGTLRSAFLSRVGLSKEAFVANGVVLGCIIDCSRLGVYAAAFHSVRDELDYWLLTVAVLAAFAGAFLGNRYLQKITMTAIQRLVAALLLGLALGLMSGVL